MELKLSGIGEILLESESDFPQKHQLETEWSIIGVGIYRTFQLQENYSRQRET